MWDFFLQIYKELWSCAENWQSEAFTIKSGAVGELGEARLVWSWPHQVLESPQALVRIPWFQYNMDQRFYGKSFLFCF